MAQEDVPADFPTVFNRVVPVHPDGGHAYFGTDVLRGLVEGIDDFLGLAQSRWRTFRSTGAALIGSAMWIDDPELLDRLTRLPKACVVVTKQARTPSKARAETMERLNELNSRTRGLPVRPFHHLAELMPRIDGQPAIVGPSTPMYDGFVPTIRTAGFRPASSQKTLPPIVHAKLALLGHTWWHDEDDFGPADYVSFRPRRLWISSANFTTSSRRSLEFGFWTEDKALLRGAEDFLLELVAHSENLDSDADHLDPDLGPVDYDDIAMAEALAHIDVDEDY